MRALVIVLSILAGVAVCSGEIITVDDDGPADFNNIQAAIYRADDGDIVEIQPGIYTGEGNRDISFAGKAITVRSAHGPEDCIIDCNGTEADPHRGFIFHINEEADSVLQGLTITNGYAPRSEFESSSGYGGAILCYFSSPTIEGCIIRGNQAVYGGGIHAVASPAGELDMTIRNCLIFGNAAPGDGLGAGGGGIRLDGDWGFGFIGACDNYVSDVRIVNCTVAGNEGGGIASFAGCEISVENCIVWGNTWDGSDSEIYLPNCADCCASSVTVSYSNVRNGPDTSIPHIYGWGAGNIDADPCFADWSGHDHHLKSQGGRWDSEEGRWTTDDVTSPCVDAGKAMSPVGEEPFPNGGIVNMGAYGGTREASKSCFGGPPCEIVVAGDLNGDCAVNFKDFGMMAMHWVGPNEPIVIPEEAWDPRPKVGERYVPTEGTMTWKLGSLDTAGYGVSYEVYIGTDWGDVFRATIGSPEFMDHVHTESYDYGVLEGGKLHFWRVDTVLTKLVPPFTKVVTKGRVWSFTTWISRPCKGVGCSGE